jgi:carbon-monoxide dehydrogenase large subunit
MGEFAIGQSVLRREDPRLLRGQGRFFDDLKLADQLHAAIVRSPHAHADITGIDTRAALQMPGVHAVLTGADYRGDGLGSLPSMAAYQRRGGGPMFLPPRPAIAFDRVMHIGYPVAVVVADALDQARDAAERVVVEYEPRPGVVSARDAFAPDAPQLYDGCPNNEAYFYQAGDKAKVDTAFAVAAHVVEQRLIINRVTANPIEPRGVTGVYDAGTGRYTLYCGFQRPWLFPQRHRPHHAQDLGGGVAADDRRYRRLLRPARLGLPGDHFDAVGVAPHRPTSEMDADTERSAHQR